MGQPKIASVPSFDLHGNWESPDDSDVPRPSLAKSFARFIARNEASIQAMVPGGVSPEDAPYAHYPGDPSARCRRLSGEG